MESKKNFAINFNNKNLLVEPWGRSMFRTKPIAYPFPGSQLPLHPPTTGGVLTLAIFLNPV